MRKRIHVSTPVKIDVRTTLALACVLTQTTTQTAIGGLHPYRTRYVRVGRWGRQHSSVRVCVASRPNVIGVLTPDHRDVTRARWRCAGVLDSFSAIMLVFEHANGLTYLGLWFVNFNVMLMRSNLLLCWA